MEKPCDASVIDRMPVEILALIFLFVKGAMTGSSKHRFYQPERSPPLLVGAVCQRWRDITLETPGLWTDNFVNLSKCAKGQFNMVEKWACRSGALPLNITIFDHVQEPYIDQPSDFWFQFKDVVWVVRSLANRWHDLSLCVPECFLFHLLNKLQGTPPINSLCLDDSCQIVTGLIRQWNQKPFLQEPLLPRRFVYDFSRSPSIPIEWNRLVSLETTQIHHEKLIDIIHHAQNLKHCTLYGQILHDPIPTDCVTNDSLIYLKANSHILGYLTLPSLRHLECNIPESSGLGIHINSVIEFIRRSRASLEIFSFRCEILQWIDDFPEFDKLPEITDLFLIFREHDVPNTSMIDNFFLSLTRSSNPILPRLKNININLPSLSPLSWSLFSMLFCENTGSGSAPIDPISSTSTPLSSRQLSQGCVRLNDEIEVPMDKDTFFRLLEAKRAGVDLIIMDKGKDLFGHMAKLHDISL